MNTKNMLMVSLIVCVSVIGAIGATSAEATPAPINEHFVFYKANVVTPIISTNMLYEEEASVRIIWIDQNGLVIGDQTIEGPIGLKSKRQVLILPPPDAVWYGFVRN